MQYTSTCDGNRSSCRLELEHSAAIGNMAITSDDKTKSSFMATPVRTQSLCWINIRFSSKSHSEVPVILYKLLTVVSWYQYFCQET